MTPLGIVVAVVKVKLRVPVVVARPGTWSVAALKTAACTLLTAPEAVAVTSALGGDILSNRFPRLLKVAAVYVPVAPFARDQLPAANVTAVTVPEGITAPPVTQLIVDVVPAAAQVVAGEA